MGSEVSSQCSVAHCWPAVLAEGCIWLLAVASAESSISEGARLRPVTLRLRVDLLLPGQLAAMLSFMGMSGDAESTWKMGRAQHRKMVLVCLLPQLIRTAGKLHNASASACSAVVVTFSSAAQTLLTVSSHSVLSFKCGMNMLMVGLTIAASAANLIWLLAAQPVLLPVGPGAIHLLAGPAAVLATPYLGVTQAPGSAATSCWCLLQNAPAAGALPVHIADRGSHSHKFICSGPGGVLPHPPPVLLIAHFLVLRGPHRHDAPQLGAEAPRQLPPQIRGVEQARGAAEGPVRQPKVGPAQTHRVNELRSGAADDPAASPAGGQASLVTPACPQRCGLQGHTASPRNSPAAQQLALPASQSLVCQEDGCLQ